MDIYDVLIDRTRELSDARWHAVTYRAWLSASLDKLHEQHREIESCRRQLAALRDENRRLRADERKAAA